MTWTYTNGATAEEIEELCRELSPMELGSDADGDVGRHVREAVLPDAMSGYAAKCRTYVARLDGRLAGICFVEDRGRRREMSFAKTRHLTEERKIAFARGIQALLAELAAREREAGCDREPMYMHVPEGDAKSEAWFVRAGCVRTADGLRCPEADRAVSGAAQNGGREAERSSAIKSGDGKPKERS